MVIRPIPGSRRAWRAAPLARRDSRAPSPRSRPARAPRTPGARAWRGRRRSPPRRGGSPSPAAAARPRGRPRPRAPRTARYRRPRPAPRRGDGWRAHPRSASRAPATAGAARARAGGLRGEAPRRGVAAIEVELGELEIPVADLAPHELVERGRRVAEAVARERGADVQRRGRQPARDPARGEIRLRPARRRGGVVALEV